VPREIEALIPKGISQPENIMDKGAPLVRYDYPETSSCQLVNLGFPVKPGFRKSVQEKNGFSVFWSRKGGMPLVEMYSKRIVMSDSWLDYQLWVIPFALSQCNYYSKSALSFYGSPKSGWISHHRTSH
jgi:hypothetical protein